MVASFTVRFVRADRSTDRSSKGSSMRRRRNSTTIASPASVSTERHGRAGPLGRSVVVVRRRRRHVATVFGFRPQRAAKRRRVAAGDLGSSARTRGVVRPEP